MAITPPPATGISSPSPSTGTGQANPLVHGFRLPVRREAGPEQLMNAFSSLGFLKMATDAADPDSPENP